jgi:uroporphyrinogen-III decarboxylase
MDNDNTSNNSLMQPSESSTEYSLQAKSIQTILNTAWQAGLIGESLASLTDLAAVMMRHGKTDEAAQALAFVMNHPDVPYDTYDRAEDLFIELEGHLCPRVIEDAKAWGRVQTLRGAVEAALAVV